MEEKIWGCIAKRLTGNETDDSKSFLDEWLAGDTAHRQQYDEVKSLWEMSALLQAEDAGVSFDEFSQSAVLVPERKERSFLYLWKYGIAAVVAGICLLGSLYYNQIAINHVPAEEWIVKRTQAGKMTRLTLPDSSEVWLNAGSEISFAKHFNDKKLRLVKLKGEAYFDVKHDNKHPFVVESGKLTTTVYGTSFNIRAYANEAKTAVAVNSGKVGVTGTDGQHKDFTVMLLPKDKLIYSNQNGKILKSAVLINEVDSWVKGELIFEQTPLAEVFETLARKYNVQINVEKEQYTACKLTARFKNQPLEAVLKTLNIALNIRSKQVKQTIYLKGGNCM